MPMTLRRPLQFALALVASGFGMSQTLPQAKAQEAGWITLFDGKDLEQWDQVGQSNWHLADGIAISDKMDGKEAGYLVSKSRTGTSCCASNSGRAMTQTAASISSLDAKKITDRTCYEANIFDQRPDPSYGTGAITRYVEINQMPNAGGKWSTFEITAKGRDITVALNGTKTAELRNGMFDEGSIALQHGAGVIKIRKVQIKPL